MDEDKELELVSKMNLLPSERVGLETKLTYEHRLIELHTEGYLTEEEYNARTEWLKHADTRAKLDLVFKDLPRITVAHRSAYEDYLTRKHKREQQPERSLTWTIAYGLTAFIFVAFACADFALGGGLNIFFGLLLLILAAYDAKRTVNGKQ